MAACVAAGVRTVDQDDLQTAGQDIFDQAQMERFFAARRSSVGLNRVWPP